MTENDNYFRYWGKAAKAPSKEYHLLVYHCLDVAAVGWLLLDPQKSLCQRLSNTLKISTKFLRAWFSFLLGIHDAGKFATAFQGLLPGLSDDLVPSNSRMPYNERHDTLGYILFRDMLLPKWQDIGGLGFKAQDPSWRKILRSFEPWIEIVTGHHGQPPKRSPVRYQDYFTAEDEKAAFYYMLALSELFSEDLANGEWSIISDKAFKQRFRSVSWLLAGLTVIADWLGSSLPPRHYSSSQIDINIYWVEHALPMAAQILEKSYGSSAKVAGLRNFNQFFPFIDTPTPLQNWAIQTGLDQGPHLFIFEDATGAGKTEAALILAYRIMTNDLADGVYVALPTMATANAMYDRLGKAYRKLFEDDQKPSLVLAHGARHLYDNFRESVGLPDKIPTEASYERGEESGQVYCSAWIADSRKKALLAEVGVGTIDQALLSILPARHQSLRLFGLYRKVLIVDEVHAFDPYMFQLLQTLIQVHANNGGSIIMLSATLPQEMRERYADSFCTGSGRKTAQLCSAPPFPLATHISSAIDSEHHFKTRPDVERKVTVSLLSDQDTVMEIIRKASQTGQCVCWIRNTVGDAITTYKELLDQPWIDSKNLSLFHSRFAMLDRRRIESETLKTFGKYSTAADRRCRILIATQVVEQSLDLDFDVMISDIAPMDLIIQRAGRLHRHVRDIQGNPITHRDAVDQRNPPLLHVFGPEPTETPKENWLKSGFPGTQAIYYNVGQIWLAQQQLKQVGAIVTPGGTRNLIEAVYGVEEQEKISESLKKLSFKAEGEDAGKRGMARLNALDISLGYTRASAEKSGGWEEEAHIPTRLSNETVAVALARLENGDLVPYAQDPMFAWELSMLSLPKKQWLTVASKIPASLSTVIDVLKKSERSLKWIEIIPLTEEIRPFYNPKMGFYIEVAPSV